MSTDVNKLIEELSKNLRTATELRDKEMAERIERKINQLIEYATGVKA